MAAAAASSRPRATAFIACIILTLTQLAAAHEHHDEDIPAGQATTAEPLDNILWLHIFAQIFAWGLLFPLGMVLGLVRSRWHVPVQTLGTIFVILGHFLGHKHKGRRFGHNVHATFAPWLEWVLFSQVVLGVYLRLHIERGFLGRVRKLMVLAHGVIGKALPVAAWVQFLFGGIVALGFCQGDHLGQCAAHFIMGSAFIGYGVVLTILLLVGQAWLRRTGRSQEFFDSAVIAAWGCVNTFTEHRWGTAWVRNDLQHTSMGIIWWCAGLLGLWLSRTRDGRPKRNIIPALVIFFTGYGMSGHPQELHLSTMVHAFFGYTLMAAGLCRIIEISFVLRDRDCVSVDGNDPQSFQYLTPFLLYASGFLFMGATEEQMSMLSQANVTHVSYILILLSIAFLLFLFVNVLTHIYAVHAMPAAKSTHPKDADERGLHVLGDEEEEDDVERKANGAAPNGAALNGNGNGTAGPPMTDRERRRVRDAQEFELDTLLGESEDEAHGREKSGRKRKAEEAGDEGRVRL